MRRLTIELPSVAETDEVSWFSYAGMRKITLGMAERAFLSKSHIYRYRLNFKILVHDVLNSFAVIDIGRIRYS